jgi:hypothetical protein
VGAGVKAGRIGIEGAPLAAFPAKGGIRGERSGGASG